MEELKNYKIKEIYVKIDNYNYYYSVEYSINGKDNHIEFVQPLLLCLIDIKRYIRRKERFENV